MKKLITVLTLIGFINTASAAETIAEKIEVKTNNVKREMKKTAHRTEEKICDKTDNNCLAKKTDHRVNETKDYMKDKASEGKNIINNEQK